MAPRAGMIAAHLSASVRLTRESFARMAPNVAPGDRLLWGGLPIWGGFPFSCSAGGRTLFLGQWGLPTSAPGGHNVQINASQTTAADRPGTTGRTASPCPQGLHPRGLCRYGGRDCACRGRSCRCCGGPGHCSPAGGEGSGLAGDCRFGCSRYPAVGQPLQRPWERLGRSRCGSGQLTRGTGCLSPGTHQAGGIRF